MNASTAATIQPTDVRLRLEPLAPTESWVATPVWPNVDRPESYSISLGPGSKGRKLAERYRAAVLAGAVFYGTNVRADVDGKTFVDFRSRVMGRHANADLRALGY